MKPNEQAFLAAVGLGWFVVDPAGNIWRTTKMADGFPVRLPQMLRAEKASSAPDGYPKVMFRFEGQRFAVYAHRAVWMVHNRRPIPDGMEINHRDGNKRNPHPDNLELVTHAENTAHSFRVLGQQVKEQRGVKNTSAKLTEADVLAIRSLCAARSLPQSEIATRYGVSQRTVSEIHTRKTWAHVP